MFDFYHRQPSFIEEINPSTANVVSSLYTREAFSWREQAMLLLTASPRPTTTALKNVQSIEFAKTVKFQFVGML